MLPVLATSVVSTVAATNKPIREPRMPPRPRSRAMVGAAASYTATSPTTAANDIWKLAESRLSGAATSTAIAEIATRRMEIAVRSIITASITIDTIRKARWVGIVAPEISR